MSIKKYTKRPVTINAVQWTGDNLKECMDFLGKSFAYSKAERHFGGKSVIAIKTLEGVMIADIFDWIIQGIAGEFYPCKPDIFDKTYLQKEEKSPVKVTATTNMTIEERILHVGGRENTQGYIEFGSVAAVNALVEQVLRDIPGYQAILARRDKEIQAMYVADTDGRLFNAQGHHQAILALEYCLGQYGERIKQEN